MPCTGRKEIFNRVNAIGDKLLKLLVAVDPIENDLAV
jgi:hypothetical protein